MFSDIELKWLEVLQLGVVCILAPVFFRHSLDVIQSYNVIVAILGLHDVIQV